MMFTIAEGPCALQNMRAHIATIARFTLLEAYRTRLPLLAVVVLTFVWAGSLFIHQIAVTESDRLQWSFYASGARLACVLVITLYITSSMVREFNEKGLELLLALDLPRAGYLLGKVAGYVALAAGLAILCSLPMALHSSPAVIAIWATSLFCELSIVAALGVFCIVTLRNVLPAAMLVCGLYVVGRTITAMRLMADTDLLGAMGGVRPLVNFSVDALAYVIPALDRFTMTEWIADGGVDAGVLGPVAMQTAFTMLVLLGAALFDFYRREL